jgi:hypothetical protein
LVEFYGPRAPEGVEERPGGGECRAALPWGADFIRISAGNLCLFQNPRSTHAGPACGNRDPKERIAMRRTIETGLQKPAAPHAWAIASNGTLYSVHVPIRPDGSIENGDATRQTEVTLAD